MTQPEREPTKLPIEPLSGATWQRIESGVRARLDAGESLVPSTAARPTPSGWRPAAAGLALAAAALLAVLWPPSGRPASPAAQPRRIVAALEPALARAGDARIRLAPEGAAEVVGSEQQGWEVRLERGRATFAVPPRAGRPAFRVRAGAVRVEVVGTRFSVARRASAVEVRVREGVVRVHAAGEQRELRRGERWTYTTQSRRAGVPAPAQPELAEDEGPRREPHAAPAEPAAQGPVARRPRARTATARPAPTPRARPGRPESRQPQLEPAASPQARFERAASLEATHPREALRLYRGLAGQSGPWAANALFAAGRLQLERGQRAEAERLLEAYLRRFPRGPNAADARALLE